MVPTLVRDAIRAAAGARRTHHDRAAVAISSPQPRRRVTLPRNVAGGRRPEPYSRADAPFFRSPGFFVRIGGLAIIVGVALCVLVLRAWSIQVLHGPQYTSLANGQAYRTVDLAGPRGAIVDSKRRKLADTTGQGVGGGPSRNGGRRTVCLAEGGVFLPGVSVDYSSTGGP